MYNCFNLPKILIFTHAKRVDVWLLIAGIIGSVGTTFNSEPDWYVWPFIPLIGLLVASGFAWLGNKLISKISSGSRGMTIFLQIMSAIPLFILTGFAALAIAGAFFRNFR